MAKETNIRFKVDMVVDGRKQAAELGMELGNLESVMEAVSTVTKKTTASIAAVMTKMEYAVNAIGRLQATMRTLTDTYAIQQEAETQLATAMRNTMGATDSQIQAIKDLCSAQQELGVIGDEVQLQGAQELATYLSRTETLKKLIPVMNDMVAQQYGLAASGENAVNIATMLGKVMNGQVGALSRLGYSFDEAQKAILQTGSEMERAAVLAEVVNQSVEGMNAALRNTSTGAAKAMSNSLGDMVESLGSLVASIQPVVDKVASFGMASLSIVQLSRAFGISTLATKGYTAAVALAAPVIHKFDLAITDTACSMGMTTVAARALSVAVKGLIASTGVGLVIWGLVEAFEALAGAADEATERFDSLSAATDELCRVGAASRQHIEGQAEALKKLIDSGGDTTAAVKGLNAEYGSMFGHMETAAEWYDTLVGKADAYAQAMGYQAQMMSLATRMAEINMEQDYQHQVERAHRTGRYGRTIKHDDEGKAALKRLNELKAEEAKIAVMLDSGRRALAELRVDPALKGEEWSPAEDDGKTVTVRVEPEAPEGSLKKLRERISGLRAMMEVAVDDQSRIALEQELSGLERQVRSIEFRYRFPGLTGDNLRELQKQITESVKGMAGGLMVPLPILRPKVIGPASLLPQGEDKGLGLAKSALDAFGESMAAVTRLTNEGAAAWLNWSSSTIAAISKALPQIVALISAEQGKAMAAAMGQNAATGPFGWIAGIAAMAGIVAAFASIPKFAEGGIAYGPTVGLFGEYPGAANNPEVVAPLSRLESIIEPRTSGDDTVRFVISGRNLEGVRHKNNRYSNRR